MYIETAVLECREKKSIDRLLDRPLLFHGCKGDVFFGMKNERKTWKQRLKRWKNSRILSS